MKSRCRQALAFFENRRSAAIFCFYRHRLCGAHELRQQYALSGRHPFLHCPSGEHELRKRVRPCRAGCFSLNLSGDLPTRQGHKRVDTYGFHPLVNLPFSLRGHGEICRAETRNGAVEDFFFRVFRNRFAVPDTGLLHRSATLRRVRHDSAAQFVSLETADGTYEDKLYWIL